MFSAESDGNSLPYVFLNTDESIAPGLDAEHPAQDEQLKAWKDVALADEVSGKGAFHMIYKELLTAVAESDVDGIMKYYNAAEKVYPYENLHGKRSANDAEHRANLQAFHDNSPDEVLKYGSPMPLLFVYLMSRASV